VAVVVPCYNYGHFLSECVQSIVTQPAVEVSVHIIDDASTDSSPAVAQRLAAKFPVVSTTLHTSNQGHISTYNEGVAAVDSDYVVLLSADDLLAPASLSRAASLMEAHPRVGLVYGNPQTFSESPALRQARLRNWSVWQGNRWIRHQFSRGLSIIYSPEAVVRTQVQHEAGYYTSSLPHSADLEMWLRIAEIADVGRINGPDQAYRRVHPDSMMQSHFNNVAVDLRERFLAYQSYLASSRLTPRELQRLEALARRRASSEAFMWAASVTDDQTSAAVEEAARFARGICRDYEGLSAYRVYATASSGASTVTAKLRASGEELAQDMGARLRWRRWRRYGV
jgi:glycosyltransferase involved in cell wall biosynthesis